MNGARGRSNNYLLDGTDMNDGYRNDPAINQAEYLARLDHPSDRRSGRSQRSFELRARIWTQRRCGR